MTLVTQFTNSILKGTFTIALLLVLGSIASAQRPFVTVWKTDNPGSSFSNEIRLPLTGSNYSITWEEVDNPTNNGSLTASSSTSIQFPSNGIYRVSVTPGAGTFHRIAFTGADDSPKIIDIEQWGDIEWSSMRGAFRFCVNLDITATDVPNLDGVTDMEDMFINCSTLNGPPNIGDWNTSTITSMESMFENALSFNQPIDNWNTSAVTTTTYMFRNASAFNQPIANWNVAAVTNMAQMFENATSFNQPINDWNTAMVSNMRLMFNNATSFNQPLDAWNVSRNLNMTEMFKNAVSFDQSLGNWTFRAGTALSGLLDGSGMSCFNYSASLIGWRNNANMPNFLNLTLPTMQYGTNAVSARNYLINNKFWNFFGDAASGVNCALPVSVGTPLEPTDDYTLFPNPATTQVSVDMSAFTRKPVLVQIITPHGVVVEQHYREAGSDEPLSFDLSLYQSGMYWITLQTEGRQQRAKKLVVVR